MATAPEISSSCSLDAYLVFDQTHHHGHEENWSLEKFSADDFLDLGGIASDVEDDNGEEQEEEEEDIASTTSVVSNQNPTLEEPIVPEGDVWELEWVSRFVDDSVLVVAPYDNAPGKTTDGRTPSAASVASISPPAVSACDPLKGLYAFYCGLTVLPCRTRSKRSRRVWSLSRPELSDPLCSSSSSCSSSTSSSASSCLVYEPHSMSPEILPTDFAPPRGRGRPPLHGKVKPKREAKKARTAEPDGEGGCFSQRCTHCGVQKTPQWRTGPMGAKTLCNACGVRYKSGRLLPEYRPACSPTFVSDVHSNSHRKVLEMRRQKELHYGDF